MKLLNLVRGYGFPSINSVRQPVRARRMCNSVYVTAHVSRADMCHSGVSCVDRVCVQCVCVVCHVNAACRRARVSLCVSRRRARARVYVFPFCKI